MPAGGQAAAPCTQHQHIPPYFGCKCTVVSDNSDAGPQTTGGQVNNTAHCLLLEHCTPVCLACDVPAHSSRINAALRILMLHPLCCCDGSSARVACSKPAQVPRVHPSPGGTNGTLPVAMMTSLAVTWPPTSTRPGRPYLMVWLSTNLAWPIRMS